MTDRTQKRAVFVISVAAELAGMHPQTLRIYERRGLIEPYRNVPAAEKTRRFRGVNQLVVFEGLAVAHGVGRPVAAVLPHQGEQQPGIKPAAQQDADRHVADQVTLDRTLVKIQQLASGLVFTLVAGERRGLVIVPALFAALALLDHQHGSRRELAYALENGQRRRRVPELQKQVQRRGIDVWRSRLDGQ